MSSSSVQFNRLIGLPEHLMPEESLIREISMVQREPLMASGEPEAGTGASMGLAAGAGRREQQRLLTFLGRSKQPQPRAPLASNEPHPNELTKLIQYAGPSSEIYEADHLKLVLQNLKIEQEQLKSEFNDIELDLKRLKEKQGLFFAEQWKTYVSPTKEMLQPNTMTADEAAREESEGRWLQKIKEQLRQQERALAMATREQDCAPPVSSVSSYTAMATSTYTGMATSTSTAIATSTSTAMATSTISCTPASDAS